MADSATNAVLRAMEALARSGKLLTLHSVPDAAARLLASQEDGRLSISDAYGLVREAIDGLHDEGRIQRFWNSRDEWRILDSSGLELDGIAEGAVMESFRILIQKGKSPRWFNVPETANKLLFSQASASITFSEATELVRKAIERLESRGKVECSAGRAWRVLD